MVWQMMMRIKGGKGGGELTVEVVQLESQEGFIEEETLEQIPKGEDI